MRAKGSRSSWAVVVTLVVLAGAAAAASALTAPALSTVKDKDSSTASGMSTISTPPPVTLPIGTTTATWHSIPLDPSVFPPGSMVTSVVAFDSELVAAGSIIQGCQSPQGVCSSPPTEESPVVWTSSNGSTWHQIWHYPGVLGGTGFSQRLVVGPNELFMFDGGTGGTFVLSSSDATTWTPVSPSSAGSRLYLTPNDIASGHGAVMVIMFDDRLASSGGPQDLIWTSADGTIWTQSIISGSSLTFNRVATTPQGFAIGGSG